MAESSVWPVVFVGWQSKAEAVMESTREGHFDAWTGKLHARKGAPCLVVVEDGRILAVGEVTKVSGYDHEVSLEAVADDAAKAPQITDGWLDKLKAVPHGFLKRPVSGLFIPPGKDDAVLDEEWFDQVRAYAIKSLGKPPRSPQTRRAKSKKQKPRKARKEANQADAEPAGKPKKAAVAVADGTEKESLLRSWIPSALDGLLEDRVRADQWEVTVAYGFRALGCEVEVRGQEKPGQAEPDCVAVYTSPTGQVIEMVIDAKAGQWNAPVDDVRAMGDYMALSEPYSYPLFVANSLGKGVQEKLEQRGMQGKTPRAMSGRDLALLIMQRLTDPDFKVELELRRLVL